jgi:hypothetical protein
MARARQCLAQRANHVRQAAGFGIRMDFATGQKDPHKPWPQKCAGELNDE